MIIRDPIHGDIYFGDRKDQSLEKNVIETKLMQRLRGIKQLGTTYLVYPGATHTRFEHSLGTAHLVKIIMDNIQRNGYQINEHQREAVSIAGLLHDVSHVPFGHTFEDERGIFKKHDLRINDFLNDEELCNVLKSKSDLKKEVTCILKEDSREEFESKAYCKDNEPWKKQIIKGTIGADLLDYLRRDAYYSGLSLNYDDRIFNYFKIDEHDRLYLDLMKHNMNRADARSEVLRVLRARFFLTERVYYHHTKLIAGSMISKAVEIAQRNHGLGVEDLYGCSDTTFLKHLLSFDDKTISTLIEGVKNRKLLKRAYVISSSTVSEMVQRNLECALRDPQNRMKTENEIIERVNGNSTNKLTDADVIVYMTPNLSKEADIYVKFDGEIRSLSMGGLAYQPMDVKEVQAAYVTLWKLYVFAPGDFSGKVESVCEKVFGIESEFIPQKYEYIQTLGKWMRHYGTDQQTKEK